MFHIIQFLFPLNTQQWICKSAAASCLMGWKSARSGHRIRAGKSQCWYLHLEYKAVIITLLRLPCNETYFDDIKGVRLYACRWTKTNLKDKFQICRMRGYKRNKKIFYYECLCQLLGYGCYYGLFANNYLFWALVDSFLSKSLMMKNAHHTFPEPKLMSLNVLFCPHRLSRAQMYPIYSQTRIRKCAKIRS